MLKLCCVLFCSIFFFYCNSKAKIESENKEEIRVNDSANKKLNYDSVILLVDSEIIDLTTTIDLLSFPKYMELVDHGELYSDDFIKFVTNKNHTWRQKLISIYSMQGMSFDNYIKVFNKCQELFDKNIISEEILRRMMYMELTHKNYFGKEYQDPQVISLLNNLRRSRKTSEEFKEFIADVLLGKAK